MKVNLFTIDGQVKDTLELPQEVFGLEDNPGLIWEVVTNYLANQRQGTAKTKTRGEVSGGGRKPWPQKHTGRARAGSIRSPLWVGGGVVFGPRPRDYSYKIPKKKKQKALCVALSMKLRGQGIMFVEDFELESHKTKGMAQVLKNLGLSDKKTVLVKDSYEQNMILASRNIPNFYLVRAADLNVYDCVVSDQLLITKKGLEKIIERLSKDKENVG
ncbi:MAG: 50S ribosomal protein L4 [candidate division WOR-3 bacterium]|nr:50S ribosomal protein L4 [candidate division WOR-3 bacterium]MCX7757508.1 50S ribosomal protein L4 [candidate division WOR-3 bacterium]MDW7987164.1 50S ribosomal protein L4 [candidate division WOR-3 bacterium]